MEKIHYLSQVNEASMFIVFIVIIAQSQNKFKIKPNNLSLPQNYCRRYSHIYLTNLPLPPELLKEIFSYIINRQHHKPT